MAKTRIQDEAPFADLPIAELFLDDIEQVIRVLRGSAQHMQNQSTLKEPALTIRYGSWKCDSLDELRELGEKATEDFSLELDDDFRFHAAFYILGKQFIGYSDGRLSNEGTWAVHGQLRAILGKRKIRWTPRRRSSVIFKNSYEYKGVLPALKRHAETITVAILPQF